MSWLQFCFLIRKRWELSQWGLWYQTSAAAITLSTVFGIDQKKQLPAYVQEESEAEYYNERGRALTLGSQCLLSC